MGSVNKVILVGRLGKDPEMKYTPSGTAVANFSIATNYAVKNEDGTYTDKTDWHNIVIFGRKAEFAGEYLGKGRLVYLEGRIQTRSWEDQSGNKRYITEIVCSDVQLLGSKGENQSEKPKEEKPANEVPTQNESATTEPEETDDLPF